MSKSQSESCVVAVRLPPAERATVAALAAIDGKAISTYVRDLLRATAAKPRPVLAAGGALLAICDTLLAASGHESLNSSMRSLVLKQAKLVIDIIRLHDSDDLA